MADRDDATQLLRAWRAGDDTARDRLMHLLHEEIHGIAVRSMRDERQDHTLQATALVNEAYMLLRQAEVSWRDRAHFLAMTARVMRRVLVDHARRRGRAKRGGGLSLLRLDEMDELSTDQKAGESAADRSVEIGELHAALTSLAENDERKARAVELHYFGGLTYDEIAEVEDTSPATVKRDLRFARAWLRDQLA